MRKVSGDGAGVVARVAIACVVLTMTANGQSAQGSKGITAVPGIRVGPFHAARRHDRPARWCLPTATCAVGGVSQRGGAPGTRGNRPARSTETSLSA